MTLDKYRMNPLKQVTKRRAGLRDLNTVDYTSEVKSQPNWKQNSSEEIPNKEGDLLNQQLERMRKLGYESIEVRKSLIPGDSGLGLFAKKKIKDKSIICSY